MSNVVDIDSARLHTTTSIECKGCGYKWIAVHVVGCEQFECKGCNGWVNHYGAPISKHVCATCQRPFTLCPASDGAFGDNCVADDCASYDPKRDIDLMLGFKEGAAPHITITREPKE